MTKLTTHCLDTFSGKPAKGIKVEVASFPKSTSVELKAVADEYLDLSKLYSKIQA